MSALFAIYKSHLRETLKLAWPVIVGQLGTILVGISDTAMVGQLPTEYASAATLANSIFFLFVVVGIGICGALTPLVAQARGEENNSLTIALLRQGIWMAIMITFLLWFIVIGCGFVLPWLGQDARVVELATEYLQILGFSILPFMLFLAYKHFLEGMELVRPGMVAIFGVVMVNIVLNYIFIYGKLGLPEMKLNGAGWATVIARWTGAIGLFIYIRARVKVGTQKLSATPGQLQEGVFRKILNVGLPSGMQYFFEVGSFTCAVVMAGILSVQAQKAHNVAIMLAATTYMVYIGISSAASIRVGNAFGARRFAHLRKAGFAALFTGIGFILLSILTFILFRWQLPSFFVNDQELQVYQIAVSLLAIAALFQVADGIQAIALGLLRGINDVKVPMIFTMIAYWGVGIPAAAVLAFPCGLGIQGLWYGLSLGLAASAVFLTVRFVRLTRVDRMVERRNK